MRVFVTDGDNRAALAVTRSLGRAGHEVVVGERQGVSLAHASRYCALPVIYPDPSTASDEFIDYLARVVRDQQVEVLLPVADITTFLITRNRERFAPCSIPFADADVIERAADKVDLVRAAIALGVPVPSTVVVPDGSSVPADGLQFPLVVKPRQSRVRLTGGWVSSSVSYAADYDELVTDLASRPAHHFPVMLQERVVGPGMGVFTCYRQGRPVAWFAHRRVRERPPWGGVSVLSESIALPPQAREYAQTLLDYLGWHGVAMVEFKVDHRDQVPKLMEINGRFWGSLQLAIDSGVDFPNLLLQPANPERAAPEQSYRVGQRTRWFWGDVDSLVTTVVRNGEPAGSRGPSRWRAVLDFMMLWGRNLHYDNPKWDDVRPWLRETTQRFQAFAKVFTAKRRSDDEPGEATVERAVIGTPPAGFRVSVAKNIEGLGVTPECWNNLAAQSDTNSVFQTYEWTRSWWDTFGEHLEPLFIAVTGRSGLTGVAPLVVDGRGVDRCVRFVGDGRSDYLDVLAAGDPRFVIEAVFRTLREYPWDVVELNNIPAGSRTVAGLRDVCRAEGYRLLVEDHFACPTLIIEGREAEARKIWNKASLRRRSNSFTRMGTLVCRDFTNPADIEPYLESFFNQHVARWANGNRSSSLFVEPRNRLFYRELTRRLGPRQWVLFSVVEFNGHPVAFHYGFDYNGSVIWYKPSFDVAFERQSPGIVMVRHLIEYALAARRRELDFTLGEEAFKRRFTNETRRTVRVRVFREPTRFYWECSKRELVGAVRKLSI